MRLMILLAILCLIAGVAQADEDTAVLILRDSDDNPVAYTAGPDDPLVVEVNHYIFRVWNWYNRCKEWVNDPEWPWDGDPIGGEGGGGGGGGAG